MTTATTKVADEALRLRTLQGIAAKREQIAAVCEVRDKAPGAEAAA